MTTGLTHGPIAASAVHICVDMQCLFRPGAVWAVPWSGRVAEQIARLTSLHAARTIFTRFIPQDNPNSGFGMWRRYYEKWANVTLDQISPTELELLPDLARFVPPATLIDKRVFSPWTEGNLDRRLSGTGITTLVITGAESDVCVLATVLGAVDRGYRVILVEDAICGSADPTHDAAMTIYRSRFSLQIELVSSEQVLDVWRS